MYCAQKVERFKVLGTFKVNGKCIVDLKENIFGS